MSLVSPLLMSYLHNSRKLHMIKICTRINMNLWNNFLLVVPYSWCWRGLLIWSSLSEISLMPNHFLLEINDQTFCSDIKKTVKEPYWVGHVLGDRYKTGNVGSITAPGFTLYLIIRSQLFHFCLLFKFQRSFYHLFSTLWNISSTELIIICCNSTVFLLFLYGRATTFEFWYLVLCNRLLNN